jgi:hypothetical protein
MSEVIYPGDEPDFDPTEADMEAYAKARASFMSIGGTPAEWMEMDRQSKVGLVRAAREQLAPAEIIPFTPSSAPSPQLGPSENTVNSEGLSRGD